MEEQSQGSNLGIALNACTAFIYLSTAFKVKLSQGDVPLLRIPGRRTGFRLVNIMLELARVTVNRMQKI